MISLLHSCNLMVDVGTQCQHLNQNSDFEWESHWELQTFDAGEEIDETDPLIDTNALTEGEDFVRL